MIVIEEVAPDDWPRWKIVRLQALADAPDAFSSTYATWCNAGEERWRARLRDVAYNVIATHDGADVGLISAVDSDPVELISLWVAPAVRGKGAGDALVRAVLAWGAPRATQLNVYPDNAHAIALYRRNGFVERGVVEGELVMVRA
ncbi:MAG TPA: GNAT family N-acetyltransferase [Kofleriaceae bacterium]